MIPLAGLQPPAPIEVAPLLTSSQQAPGPEQSAAEVLSDAIIVDAVIGSDPMVPQEIIGVPAEGVHACAGRCGRAARVGLWRE